MSVPHAPVRDRLGLTPRGWVFLACGLAAVTVGLLRGLIPAVQFGTLLAALPLVAAAATRNPGRRLAVRRVLSARELPSGDELHVTLEIDGRFARGSTLLLEDLCAPALGIRRRLALTGVSGRAIRRPQYRIRVGSRGMHRVGPLQLHVMDRFGMVHRVHPLGLQDHVVVVPRVVPLDALVLGGASLGSGAGHLGALGAASDDVIPREYRAGDEVRRIDWKASARSGSLMVRSEENPWRSSVTIVVDLRESTHCGRSPDSSVDAALSIAASVASLALENAWDVDVRTSDDELVFSGSPLTGVDMERWEMLRALALVPLSPSTVPSPTLRHTADVTSRGPVVLVATDLSASATPILAGVGAHSSQRILLALEADGWREDGSGPDDARDLDSALAMFQVAGWRVARVPRHGSLAAAWVGLGS